MKSERLLTTIITSVLLLIFQGCGKDNNLSEPTPVKKTGYLQIVDEPRLEDPCMPGMVFALATNECSYVIMKHGQFVRWQSDSTAIEVFGCSVGDTLSLMGIVKDIKDLNGDNQTIIMI
jgi:hypothetical protein